MLFNYYVLQMCIEPRQGSLYKDDWALRMYDLPVGNLGVL